MLPLIGNVEEYFTMAEYFAPGQEAPAAAVEDPPAPPNSPLDPDMPQPDPDPELPAPVPDPGAPCELLE